MQNFKECESGATAIEYSLIAGLIALAIFGAVKLTGSSVEKPLAEINNRLQN